MYGRKQSLKTISLPTINVAEPVLSRTTTVTTIDQSVEANPAEEYEHSASSDEVQLIQPPLQNVDAGNTHKKH